MWLLHSLVAHMQHWMNVTTLCIDIVLSSGIVAAGKGGRNIGVQLAELQLKQPNL